MDVKLTFMGAARGVTGSRYLLETPAATLLVDCGLYQEREFQSRNWEEFRCAPSKLEAVLLTHAHLDHCGLLPKLVREGFHGRVFCTPATADITKIILLDSAKIQEEDAAYKKKRHQREGRQGPYPEIPLYTIDDAEASLGLFSPVDYNQTVEVAPGVEATFHDAGHVLGSAMIKLRFTQNGEARSIVFSGDIGRWDRPILQDPNVFRLTDYLVMESTYGDRVHEDTGVIADQLAEIVNEAYRSGGNIIVPSFALQRAQEILYYLNELLIDRRIPSIDVYVDSPMANRITQVFRHHAELFDADMRELLREHHSPFNFPGLKTIESVDQSKALNGLKGTYMIIAGSGMCTGGRIKHHLVNNISRPETTVLFVGYQAVGTLGRLILDGTKTVRIHGKQYSVNARIKQIQGFSAHADKNELLKWVSKLSASPRHVYLTHGEAHSAEEFRKFLQEHTGYEVSVPAYSSSVTLE